MENLRSLDRVSLMLCVMLPKALDLTTLIEYRVTASRSSITQPKTTPRRPKPWSSSSRIAAHLNGVEATPQ